MKKIIVIGGGYAGLMALSRMQKLGSKAQIILIDTKNVFHQRIRTHEWLAGSRPKTLHYEKMLQPHNIKFIQSRVDKIEPGMKRVHLVNGKSIQVLTYDYLVYSPGSFIDVRNVVGADKYAISLNPNSQLSSLKNKLSQLPSGSSVYVVGAGLTGIEMAGELIEKYPQLKVTLVSSGAMFDSFSPKAQTHLATSLSKHAQLMQKQKVVELTENRIRFSTGEERHCDLCLWTTGFTVPDLAAKSGIQVINKRVVVDETLRSVSHPTIFAAGDAAMFKSQSNQAIRMGCATALPMGAQAGKNILSLIMNRPPEPLSFAYFFRCISLGRNNGLIELTDMYDTPRNTIYINRVAATIKELVCKMTFYSLKWEFKYKLPFLYWWPKLSGKRVRQLNTRSNLPVNECD